MTFVDIYRIYSDGMLNVVVKKMIYFRYSFY